MALSHEKTMKEIQRLERLEASLKLVEFKGRVRALGGDPEPEEEEPSSPPGLVAHGL